MRQFPEEIYGFHKELDLNYMQFIPCVETDSQDLSRAALFSVSFEEFGNFLCKLFDLWLDDFEKGRPTTSIRFFDSVFFTYVGLTPPECTLLKECGVYVVVEHNGDFYACDHYVDAEHCLGNIQTTALIELLESPAQREFGRAKADTLPRYCRECNVKTMCNGECPKNRFLQTPDGESGLNYLCAGYKRFFTHCRPFVEELASLWHRRQPRSQPPSERATAKIGRNDPCPCGSGRKYKKCCLDK